MLFKILAGIFIPFLGTAMGAAFVFFGKSNSANKWENTLNSFAGGVMLAASVWSLLIPAIDSFNGNLPIVSFGFIFGIVTLIYADKNSDKIYVKINRGVALKSKETLIQILAVIIHNFPEGLAVGVIFATAIKENDVSAFSSAMLLSFGIAIQNIPEGAIVSVPLFASGERKLKSFILGTLSGIVEPIGAIIAILLSGFLDFLMPFLMAFSAGTMIYVTMCQLAKPMCESENSSLSVISFSIGFLLMMSLDVIFG